MKLLHIGKTGNVGKYTVPGEFTKQVEVVSLPAASTIEEITAKAGDADFLVADAMAAVSAALIEQMPNLKLIHSEGVGFNFFDLKAARDRGIPVCNCKGANASAVAEQTLLLMLGVLKNVIVCDRDVRCGNQITRKEGYMLSGNLMELADCKVGLIGFGDIAKCVAKLLQAFGTEVYYYSRRRAGEEQERQYGVTYLPLEELLSKCNMISIHKPLTPETKNSIDDAFFAQMQDGSYIINTARGELIDSYALIRALESGKLAMAGLDTIAGEPVKADNILLTQSKEIEDKLVLSPHIGGLTRAGFARSYAIIWDNIQKAANGETPNFIVNP